MKITKKSFVFVFLVISALVIGSIIVSFCSPTSFLGTCIQLGLSNAEPLLIDLVVIKLSLGFSLNIGIAHIVMLIIAIVVYPFIAKNLE